MMKRAVDFFIIAYLLLVGFVLIFGFFAKRSAPTPPQEQPQQSSTTQTTPPGPKTYTPEEVATHSNAKDCWLIIENQVFDVTQFLVEHPGGINMIMPFCGKEATEAFKSKGGTGGVHSQTALTLKQHYYIGDLQK